MVDADSIPVGRGRALAFAAKGESRRVPALQVRMNVQKRCVELRAGASLDISFLAYWAEMTYSC